MSWESWLKDKMDRRKYPHKDQAIKDVANALRKYSDLKPEIARFDPGNGRPDEFISCVGTIPVRYRDKVYNIPIKILLLASHPFQPPIVYVTPTSNMVIKPGKHVDNYGRVYLPYLTDWRSPSSDLYELIQILCLVFGDDPPVFAKAGQAPGRPPPPNLGGQQFYQGTPYPTSQSASMPMPNMQPGGYYPPTSLPYPGSNSLPPYPTTQAGLPPYPAAAHPYPPTTNYPASNSQPQQQQQQQQQPSVTPYPRTTSAYPPPKSTSTVQRDGDNQTFQARSAPTRQGSVMDPEVVKMSMLSSVEDKLKKRVNEVFEQGKQELDDLTNTNTELKQRGQQLSRTVERLEQDEKMAMSNVEMLTKKNEELQDLLTKLQRDTENMQIDEAIVTTAPLYNQILNTYAEENAVEDAIYHLGEALRREVIDVETFLKNVRSLSRKQFFLRAQLKKARKTAGLKELTIP